MRFLVKRYRWLWVLATLLLFVLAFTISNYFYYRSKIETSPSQLNNAPVAIVFGAGLKADGTPSDILKDRLKVVAKLYRQEKVEQILVSGDNPSADYDEPTSMFNYLTTEEGVPSEHVHLDFAGRRTYDTCARARTVWGIEHAILVTQLYHLPRALLLCSRQGIESQGVSATLQPYVKDTQFTNREHLAFIQAIWESYIWAPHYLEGPLEKDLDQIAD